MAKIKLDRVIKKVKSNEYDADKARYFGRKRVKNKKVEDKKDRKYPKRRFDTDGE